MWLEIELSAIFQNISKGNWVGLMHTIKNIGNLMNRNILEVVSDWYRNLDKRYKIAFFVALVLNVVSYFFFIAHQPLHNHGMRSPWINPYEQWVFGRWFTYFTFTFFNCAAIPVILPIASIVLHILSAIFTCLCWEKRPTVTQLTFVTLFVSLYPAMLITFFYSYGSPNFSFAFLFAALALYISSSFTWKRLAGGSLFIMLAMASYQPSLSVFLTIFMGSVLIKIVDFEGSGRHFMGMVKNDILPQIFAIIGGGIAYRVSLLVLGISMNTHATKSIDFSQLSELLTRFVVVVKVSFKHLYVTQPELLISLKATLLLVVFLALLLLVLKSFEKKWVVLRIPVVCFLFCCTVVATKALFFLSPTNEFYNYRYNFALGYFYAFCFFILLGYVNKVFLKNLIVLLCLFVVVKYSYANLIRQHVIMRAQQHDLALANRILYRIESLPDIDLRKKYELIRLGKYSNFRLNLLRSKGHGADVGGGAHMDVGDITDVWCPADVMKLLGSKVQWKYYVYTPNFNEKISYARKHLIKGRYRWPHKDSVFIHGDIVYVYIN